MRHALGLASYELEHWHESVQELLAYRRLSGDFRYDSVIADSYRRLGRPERALELLDALQPEHVPASAWIEAQIVRARALAETGRKTAAMELLRSLPRLVKPPAQARARLDEAMSELSEI